MEEPSEITINKKTLIPIGVLVVFLPAVFWFAQVHAKVEQNLNDIQDIESVLNRIDDRTRQTQIDTAQIKSAISNDR